MKSISMIVTDGDMTWLETQRFSGYGYRQARQLFKDYIEQQGWVIV